MAAPAETILFQAVCTPPPPLTRRGYRVLAMLLGVFACGTGTLFLTLGAWPVLPFLGLEVLLALGLVALHGRGAMRSSELVILTPERLRVARTDRRGRRYEAEIEAYWARLSYAANPAHAGILRVESRGRSVEVGRDLALEEKLSLRDALEDALARLRQPVFDNPQLREG